MSAGKYVQCYIHLVFAVKNREALLTKDIRNRVFEYISGIIRGMNHKSINVNGVSDHIHILIGFCTTVTISDTVHEIKRSSSLFINENGLCKKKFAWQEGYGCFSYGQSQIEDVYNYIENQEKHHEKSTFKSEYTGFLKKYKINYDDRYLFDFGDV
jgi:putative transposase